MKWFYNKQWSDFKIVTLKMLWYYFIINYKYYVKFAQNQISARDHVTVL